MMDSIAALSILYVEDDMLSREVMKVLLTQVMGVSQLSCFEDSSGFMERIEGLPYIPDIILLDIHMTPLTGFDLLKLLRGDERYKNSTIIALTASVMSDEVQELRTAGFDGLISKPINQRLFPERINQILSRKDAWFMG
jgi:two-component system, cell cycle response regulator DivK